MEAEPSGPVCNTIFHPKAFSDAGGVVYLHRRWPKKKKTLRVHFSLPVFHPIWKIDGVPVNSLSILEIANIWRRRSETHNEDTCTIPEFVMAESRVESDIRVLLSSKYFCLEVW